MGESAKRLQTSLGGFSEITAISQRAINGAMVKLLELYPEIGHVSVTTKRGDSLEARIGKAQVILKVTGASREDLAYTCQFSSGTLTFNYYPEWEENPESGRLLIDLVMTLDSPLMFDVTGWTIAFSVDIGLEDIEPGSEEDQKVRSVLNQPGDFSIKSLFLLFNQANIIKLDPDNCDFKGAALDQDDISALGGVLADWYVGPDTVMADRQKRTIGYGLCTTKPSSVNQQAPTFPPTSLKFQTYEYIAPGSTEPQEGLGKGDNNMLLYLQMTDNQKFPDTAILPYTGNFVADGMDGTMCVDRKIFWDDYLLRKLTPQLLQSLNRATYAWVKSTDQSNSFNLIFNIGLGDPGHSDDYFLWNPKQAPFDWSWNPDEAEQRYHNTHNGDGDANSLRITCTTANTMTTQPGSNKIHIGGTTSVMVEAGANSKILIAPWSYDYKIHAWIEWTTTVTLSAVEDGGIQISLGLPSDPTSAFPVQSEVLDNNFDIPWGDGDEITETQKNQVVGCLQGQLGNFPLADVEAELQKNLNGAARFVVPGGGSFSYKNPMFNDNGDLFVEVSYQDE
ncbi:hypothetical protein BBP40_011116 [Aspergillus hancockii]|nr:hypothetical protein BBP40_011116 [Aspergillus hancockii]